MDEVCAYSAPEALGVLFLNGEPQQAIIAGDPMQLSPRNASKTAELLFGTTTIATMLHRHPFFYNENLA
jgi:hypothetical protein